MKRAEARQRAREMGWRGKKAKRTNVVKRLQELRAMQPMADLMRLREAAAKEG